MFFFNYLIYLPSFFLVDCEWDKFGAWSTCTETCGGGEQFRTRKVKTKAAFGGAACPGNATETQACNENACPGRFTFNVFMIFKIIFTLQRCFNND